MTARIGLLGGESTGKSSLAAALAEALPACIVPEQVRAFVSQHGRPPRQDEQAGVLQAQARAEAAVIERCPLPVVVCDPAPLMTAVYSEVYFDDPSLTGIGVDLAAECALLVWCDDDIPWTADGAQRDGVAARRRAQEVIARVVADELLPRGLPVTRVTGDLPARTAAVLQAWQTIGPAGPT